MSAERLGQGGAPADPGAEERPVAPPPISAPTVLRPKKRTFLLTRIVPGLVSLLVMGVVGGYFLAVAAPVALPLLALALLLAAAVVVYGAFVAYRKERYTLRAGQIVATRGGLMSDEQTELDVRNITHVKLRLPWLRYRFFGVGDVYVESAGIGTSAVALRTIRDPEGAYARIREMMARSGFSLRQEELLHQEQPDPVGISLECVGIAVGSGFALVFVGIPFGGFLAAVTGVGWLLLLLIPLAAILWVGFVALRFLDLRRRSYRVYGDVIVYEEGFLTRDNAYMPAENLADSNTRRTLLHRLLGLYDVEVSCQGSGDSIRFRHLRRGEELAAAIDRVIAAFRSVPRPGRSAREATPATAPAPAVPAPTAVGEALPSVQTSEASPTVHVAAERAWTAELQMHIGRAAAAPLLFCLLVPPLIPLWLLFLAQALIQASFTTFQVRSGSVRSTFRFLSSREREFSYDKITGVVVRESFLDRWLGTVTVQLWSIGAAQPLDLLHVRRSELDLPALLEQVGIPAPALLHQARSHFSLVAACAAHLPGLAVVAFALAVAVPLALRFEPWLLGLLALAIPLAVARSLYLRVFYRRARLLLHRRHVELEEGVLFRRTYRARYENVKKTVLTRYPLTELGRVELMVAGEQRRGQKGKEIVVPYGFGLRYATGLELLAVALDEILEQDAGPEQVAALEGRVQPRRPAALLESRPALANSLAKLVGISILLLPLTALLPVTLPWVWIAVRRRRYVVEPHRVVAHWGVIYRHQASILHSRIDTLRHSQGALNKLFGNGNVTLFTAGSSQPDLVLTDLPDFLQAHQTIQERYER